MLNFLPKNNRKTVAIEYFSRTLIIFLSSFFVSLLVLIILFIPSAIFSKYKYNSLTIQLNSIKATYQNTNEDPTALIKKINTLTRLLSVPDNFVSNSDVIKKIVALKSDNIKIISFSIMKADSVRKISISGTALSRDDLTLFDKNLKKDGFFSNVNLPISDLIKDGSDFNITMTSI